MDARDPLELMLLKSWRKVLGIPKIGIRDNFFDLGGHSLLSARLLSEVEKIAGREIPLSALFRGATVESLAQAVDKILEHQEAFASVARDHLGTE